MKRPRPWHVVAATHLSRLGLTPTQILVGRALLDFATADRVEVFPSLATLADRVGLTDRGVRKVLRKLEAAGAIQRVLASRGGRTQSGQGISNRWRLTFAESISIPDPRLEAADGESETPTQSRSDRTGDNPERLSGLDAFEPGTERPRTRNAATDNPEQRSEEASIHEVTKKPLLKPPEEFSSRKMDGCQDTHSHEAPSLRQRLMGLGVMGENLEILSMAPGLTAEMIEREWISVLGDRSVRSHAAVLVKRLAQRLGIELKTRPLLASAEMAYIKKIEERRRHLGRRFDAPGLPLSDLARTRGRAT